MERILKVVFLSLTILLMAPSAASADNYGANETNSNKTDWDPVMNAIIEVESNGNSCATNGKSVGAMQITPVLVAECNQILRKKKSKKRFKLSDRFSIAKSKEMFLLIQSIHNPLNDIEKAIRAWNGGLNYSVRRTQRYFEKVMKVLGAAA